MSALQGIASSPKVNRYLPWVAGVILLAGVVAFLIAYYGNTVKANPNDKVTNTPASVEPNLGKAIKVPPAARSVAARFIDAAVRGKDPALAWKLSGPEIRQGVTLKQWLRDWHNPNVGVPIQPYPADKRAQMLVDYSRQKEIQLKFALLPIKGSGQKAQMFLMLLDRIRGEWRVNSWQSYSPPAIPAP
jgi:hypothetical protein